MPKALQLLLGLAAASAFTGPRIGVQRPSQLIRRSSAAEPESRTTTKGRELAEALQNVNLYLIGMMGSGKTSVGELVSRQLGSYTFLDTDATLEAANEKLEREVRALRRAAETANEENKSARANAARHLRAAEDHVGLLFAESRAKADAIAEELERAATASEGPGAGEDPPGASGSATASAGERRELERLRAEVRRFADAQASLDAEAEEREGELAAAWAKIRELQAALVAAGG